MNNARRRRQFMVFCVMLGNSVGVTNLPKYASLKQTGPFPMLDEFDRRLRRAVPDDEKRVNEINAVKMVVNQLTPRDFSVVGGELQLWYTCQFVRKMISEGMRLPQDRQEAMFLQNLFDMAGSINGQFTIPPMWTEALEGAPTRVRTLNALDL